jgi:protein TonB
MRQRSTLRSRLPLLIGGILMLLMAIGVWLLRGYLASAPPTTKKVVQEIQVIRPPPPPPDTPPPPPPPPEEKVEIDEPQPEQQPDPAPSDEPPPGEQLGVDAEGTGAGDGFGLVGRKGGRDLLASGGNAVKRYVNIIKDEVQDKLSNDPELRGVAFSASIRLWIREDGTVERAQLVGSTGNAERDRAIGAALGRLRRLSQGPPAGTPQPISYKLVSRV